MCFIGFELSHILAACGAKVVILSNEESPLSTFDNELIDSLVQATLKKGIDVRLGFEAHKIDKTETGFSVEAKRNGLRKAYHFDADLVIHSAGRIPAIETLRLSNIGVITNEKKGVEVNEYLQTTAHNHLFALGDVTGNLPFTEIAGYEGGIVAHNILHPKDLRTPDYLATPSVVFTHPKLSSVGKSEAEVKESDIEYEVFSDSFSKAFIQRTQKNDFARYKVIIDKKNRKILGANILGHGAEDLINIFAICIQAEITADKLSNMLMAYPTPSRQAKSFF